MTVPIQSAAMTDQEIHDWWASENGLEDCEMRNSADFHQVVRAVEARLALAARPVTPPEAWGRLYDAASKLIVAIGYHGDRARWDAEVLTLQDSLRELDDGGHIAGLMPAPVTPAPDEAYLKGFDDGQELSIRGNIEYSAFLEGIAERGAGKLDEQERGHLMDLASRLRAAVPDHASAPEALKGADLFALARKCSGSTHTMNCLTMNAADFDNLAAALAAPSTPPEGLTIALIELVAVKDLQESLPELASKLPSTPFVEARKDYERRKPLAWKAARAALAAPSTPPEALSADWRTPEWAKRDDLGGKVPSEIRMALREAFNAGKAAPSTPAKDES